MDIIKKVLVKPNPIYVIIVLCILCYYLWHQTNIIKIYLFYYDKVDNEWCKVEDQLSFSNYKLIRINGNDPRHAKLAKNFEVDKLSIVKVFPNGIREYYTDELKCKLLLEWIYV